MNRIAVAGILFLIGLPLGAGAQGEWRRLGPPSLGQNVYTIGVHSTNPEMILIGCRPEVRSEAEVNRQGADAIDLTTDGGITWTQVGRSVTSTAFDGPNENSARFNPYFPGEAWVGIEKHGAFHSADGGKTWRHVASGMSGEGLNGICFGFDPRTPNTVYYGSDWGVYKSVDAGQNWTPLRQGLPHKAPGSTVGSIVVDPTHPDTVYAAFAYSVGIPAGVYKSTDAGEHWAFAGKGLPVRIISGDQLGVTDLVLGPQDPVTLYAVLEVDLQNNPADKGGIYESANGGADWKALALPPGAPTTIAVCPGKATLLFVGCENGAVFRSEDGGATWRNCSRGLNVGKTNYPIQFTYEGADGTKREDTEYFYQSWIRELAFGRKAPFSLYAATTDGVFVLKP